MSQSTFNPRKKVLFLALAIVAIDQLLKYWVVANLEGESKISLIPPGALINDSWVWLEVTRNTGAAFGFGSTFTYVFSALAVLVIGLIYAMAKNFTNCYWLLTLGFMMGGAAGNLLDRILRSPGPLRGAVVDYLAVKNFSIFNLADAFITIAAVLIVFLTVFKIDEKQR